RIRVNPQFPEISCPLKCALEKDRRSRGHPGEPEIPPQFIAEAQSDFCELSRNLRVNLRSDAFASCDWYRPKSGDTSFAPDPGGNSLAVGVPCSRLQNLMPREFRQN